VSCLNLMSRYDDDIVSYLQKLKDSPGFENTLFYFFSDHGSRYGPLRQILQGKLEERLPAMIIKVPDYFPAEFPDIINNLRNNQDSLTTPYDLFATFQHTLNFPDAPQFPPYQQSLFSPIPLSRTCADARVDSHWCSCRQRESVEISDEIVRGTQLLVAELNSRLHEHGEGRCAEIFLSKVISAEKYAYDNKMITFNESSNKDGRVPKFGNNIRVTVEYQVQFELQPGGGILEGDFKLVGNNLEVGMHFSRVNEYGTLKCSPNPMVREFCVCLENFIEETEEAQGKREVE